MKKRILPFIFFTLFVGFSFLLVSISFAGTPEGKGKDVSRISPEMNLSSPLNLDWQELGPINGAGRTRAIIYDNRDATGQTLYTGGVAGGVWRSTNLGLTWHQVNTEGSEVLKVSCMAQTATGTIYLGTGEMSCFRGSYIGSGLYRSEDGENFVQVPGTQPLAGQFISEWAYILDLEIAPDGRIYAATSTGLKYSNDGNTWLNALNGVAIDVEVGPDNSVLAAVDLKVFLAVNGDVNNFTDLSTGTPTTLPNAVLGYNELAIAPSDANVMYVAASSNIGVMLNVYASFDKGTTWSIIFPGSTSLDPFATRGCYANTLQVFPTNPGKVLFGGLNMWVGEKISTGFYNWEPVSIGSYLQMPFIVYVPFYHHAYTFNPLNPSQFAIASDDGISIGTIKSDIIEFRHAIKGLEISQFVSVAASSSKNAVIGGAEYLGVTIIPGDLSPFDPKTGVQLVPGVTGQVAWSVIKPNSIFYATGITADPIARSEDLGSTRALSFNDSIQNSIPSMPIYLWESFNFSETRDTVKFTANAGAVAQDSTIIIKSKTGDFPIHYTTPQAIAAGDSILIPDPIASRFFLAGNSTLAGKGIWMTKDALTFSVNPQWFKLAVLAAADTVTTITVSKDLTTLWAGTTKGKVIRLKNIDQAYNFATADIRSALYVIVKTVFDSIPGIQSEYISSIAVSDNNESVLVSLRDYGLENNIFLSTNSTDSIPLFTSVKGNLPDMPVYTAIFEMTNQNRVILGSDYGVFSTLNINANPVEWGTETAGIRNVPVTQIKQQTSEGIYYQRPQNYGYLYISTLGRGFFMDSTFAVVLGVEDLEAGYSNGEKISIRPNPFTDNVTITFDVKKASNVDVTITDITGRTVKTITLGNYVKGEHSSSINLGSLQSGTYIINVKTSTGSANGKALKVR